MSHLLKNRRYIIFFVKFFLLTLFSIIFFRSINNYPGSKIVYLLFSLVSFYLIIFSFRKKAIFFETFFGVYLFLGFWFKSSLIFFLETGFSEGISSEKINIVDHIDYALIISIVGFSGFLIAGHFRENFFYYPFIINKINHNEFYKKYRKIILITFIIFIIILGFFNWHLKIYQKGLVSEEFNFILSGIIKTLLLYGLTVGSAIIFFLELTTYKKIFPFTIFVSFLETFITTTSMLSRGFFFNIGSLFFGLYKLSNKMKIKLNLKFFFKVLIFLIIFSFISIFVVNYTRLHIDNEKTYLGKKEYLLKNILGNQNQFSNSEKVHLTLIQIKHLLVHRWVGIDAAIIVSANKDNLNFNLLKDSLNERFDLKSHSFYENTFNLKPFNINNSATFIKGNTLPGLIAYLFFSGSFIFLFLSMMLISFLAFIFEFISFRLLSHNLIFSAIIGHTIAYRFAHFGYLPSQSYLLFGSIIGIILLIYFVKIIFKKKFFNIKK
jgi:hypothetical protein